MEFHCLLAKLGSQITKTEVQGLLHFFKQPRLNNSDSFHALFSLEAMGHIDHFSLNKLQEALSNIEREDLVQDILEYKQSAVYKKAMEEEMSRRRVETKPLSVPEIHLNRRWRFTHIQERVRRNISNEQGVATELLPGADNITNKEKKRWHRFAMVLTHTTQLKEQMEDILRDDLLHEDWMDSQHTRVTEALHLIRIAQGDMESLSMTLKRASSFLGLTESLDIGMLYINTPVSIPCGTNHQMFPTVRSHPSV